MADKMLFVQLQVNLNRAMSGFSYHVKWCHSSGPLDCSTAFDCLVVIEWLCCVTCAEGIRAVYSANRCPALWCAYNVTGLHLSLVNIANYPGYRPCTDNFAFANAFPCLKGRFGSLQNSRRNFIDPSGKSLSVDKGYPCNILCYSASNHHIWTGSVQPWWRELGVIPACLTEWVRNVWNGFWFVYPAPVQCWPQSDTFIRHLSDNPFPGLSLAPHTPEWFQIAGRTENKAALCFNHPCRDPKIDVDLEVPQLMQAGGSQWPR